MAQQQWRYCRFTVGLIDLVTDGDDRRTSRTLMCVTDWYIVSCGEIGASRTALHNVLRYKINNDYTLDNEIQLKETVMSGHTHEAPADH